MKYLTAKDIALKTMQENEKLRAENARLNAILEYLSMMADIEIPDEEEEAENGAQ